MKKIAIIHGELHTGVQKKAIALLSELLLDATGCYPACFRYDETVTLGEAVRLYVGTRENHPALAAFALEVPQREQGYILCVRDGVVCIEGYDDAGTLYGCMDFYNIYMVPRQYTHDDHYYVGAFDRPLTDFTHVSRPAIRERGIWTWGHVIYDFRGLIDNMVKLKMNTLIVWNDRVPVNAAEMVAYAHDCGVRIIWGYAWLWDTDCRAVDFRHLEDHCEEIFAQYEREYAPLGGDGIYFQTATEMDREVVDGVVVADAVTVFVNRTAALFLEKYPEMELQFGLHATSVKTRLDSIARVDPRIRIVWEDCGAFPFAYHPDRVDGWPATVDFVRTVEHLRGAGERFGAVTKGFTKLDWYTFEHLHGACYPGVSSREKRDERVRRKSRIWRYIQAYWLTHAAYARDMTRLMAQEKAGELCVTALVEDGMLEQNIMFPVALYAEMLWNGEGSVESLTEQVALREYVTFA